MQPTNLEKPTELEMWWPHPSAFDDLDVTDAEDGWQLSAPDGTECAAWLAHWDQDEEHRAVFHHAFLQILLEKSNSILEQYGESQIQHNGQEDHRVTPEDDLAGSQSEHEPGGNTESPQA